MNNHREPPEFDLFIGIDWSGAKGESHRGIAVSEADKQGPVQA